MGKLMRAFTNEVETVNHDDADVAALAKRAHELYAEAKRLNAQGMKLAKEAVAAKTRVARAYILLRDLRSIREQDAMTPACARYVDAHSQLQEGDLEAAS